MNKISSDRLLAESQLKDIEKGLEQCDHPDAEKLREDFEDLKEEISTGDWGRIGTLAGLLWYKLDMLIKEISNANNHLKDIQRNTSKIK